MTIFLVLSISPAWATSSLSGKTIVLDPGHGVIDYKGRILNPGKSSRDQKLWEHQLTLQIAHTLGERLARDGAVVIYTRTPDDYWRQSFDAADDNKARGKLAVEFRADAFISVHCDWDPRARIKGITTYYRTAESRPLGEAIHSRLIRMLKATDRKLRKDTFTVLENVNMPAILLEAGFISHRAESKKLADASYQRKIADAILAGLESYFAQNPSDPRR